MRTRSCCRALPPLLAAAAALLPLSAPALAAPRVVISQVNGNGGLNGDLYDRDFIELFNAGDTPQNLAGWSIQIFDEFGGVTPTTPRWDLVPLSGTIQPGQYFLVVPVGGRGGGGDNFFTQPLPPADVLVVQNFASALINPNTARNAVALMRTAAPLADGACPVGSADLVDFVRSGDANALCVENGAVLPPITAGADRTLTRNLDGCQDGDNNVNDFQVGQTPNPRNASTNAFVAAAVSAPTVRTDTGGAITLTLTRGTATCNPLAGPLTAATANLSAFGGPAAAPLASQGGGTFAIAINVPAGQAVGRYDIPLTSTDGVTSLQTTAVLRVVPAPATNDDCASAVPISLPFAATINASQATTDAGADNCSSGPEARFSVWYSFTTGAGAGALHLDETSSEDIVFSLHTACGTPSIFCLSRDQEQSIPVEPNTAYLLQISQETGSTVAPQVPVSFTVSFEAAPVNDLPCGALQLSTFPAQVTASIHATSKFEPVAIVCDQQPLADPNLAARWGVWYRVQGGPRGGRLTMSEDGPTGGIFGTWTIFDSDACAGSFNEVDCEDETGGASQTLDLLPNINYYLLYSVNPHTVVPTGPSILSINFTPVPEFDSPCGATPVPSFPFSDAPSMALATNDDVSTDCDNPADAAARFGIWYAFTAPVTGFLTADETTATDVLFSLFTGDCGSLSYHSCDWDDAGARLRVTAGAQYRLLVSANAGTTPPTAPLALSLALTEDTGACCSGSSCSVITATACAGISGATFQGYSTACPGGPQRTLAVNTGIPNINASSPAPGELTRTLQVSGAGTVSQVRVSVEIHTPNGGDVTIRLTSPGGASATLIDRPASAATCPAFRAAGTANDLNGVYAFTDSAGQTLDAAVVAATNPPSGDYLASDCLGAAVSLNTVFAGQPVAGDWTVSVTDSDDLTNSYLYVGEVSITLNAGADNPCGNSCPADFNGSGVVDVTDIFAFLSAWFAQGPGSDFNGDAITNVTDIFAFLSAWFAGCD